MSRPDDEYSLSVTSRHADIPSRRLAVEFSGSRAGTAALTWAQSEIWTSIARSKEGSPYYNIGRRFPISPDRTVAMVEEAVRSLIVRYEAFRTTVHRAQDGTARQRLHGDGEYGIDVFDTTPTLLGEVVEDVWTRLTAHTFGEAEWLTRFALVTCDGSPETLLICVSHLAIDRRGMDLVIDALGRLFDGSEPSAPCYWQPFDQAAFEATPRGQRRARRSIEYWRATMSTAPQTMFPVAGEPSRRPWPWVELRSTALATATGILAARHRSTPPGVVLTAAAALIGARAGTGAAVMTLVSGNRFAHQVRDMIGTCTQTALFKVELDDCSFGAFVSRAWGAMVEAYRHAQYPAPLLRGVVDDVSVERSMALDLSTIFENLMDTGPQDETADPVPAREALAAKTASTVVRHSTVWPQQRRFSMEARTVPQAIELRLGVDPVRMSPPEAEQLLRGVEALLVRAVHEDFSLSRALELSGLTTRPHAPAMALLDHSWIDLDAVGRMLTEIREVRSAVLTVNEPEQLVADIVVSGDKITHREVHRICMDLLTDRITLRAPDRYRLRTAPNAPVFDEGSGRD